MKLPKIKFAKTETLVLRCCRHDFTSRDGFQWKKKGTVTAPDWEHRPCCGNGLYGWKHGEGDHSVWEHDESDVWMVLAVKTKSIVKLDGKVKFPTCRVLFTGKREVATALIKEHYPAARVIYGTATAGNYGTATAGYNGTATAGNYGTATAGYNGIIQIKLYDFAARRYRIVLGYIGENGLEAGRKYKLDSQGQFVEVK